MLNDMLGLGITGRAPKFVKNFMNGQHDFQGALKSYIAAVKEGSFPSAKQCCFE